MVRMPSPLRTLAGLLIVLLCSIPISLAAIEEEGQQQRVSTKRLRPTRAGTFILSPAQETDADLSEAVLTIDEDGRGRMKLGGPLRRGVLERMIVIVDVDQSSFRVFKLSDSAKDAKRIHRFFRNRGIASSEADIQDYLTREKSLAEQQVEARRRAPEADLHLSGPSGCDVEPISGNLDCGGNGFARVQTWEPAKYIFPVTHLTETQTSAWWTRNPSGSVNAGRSGSCWANPLTFVATHWIQLACYPNLYNYGTSFDATTTGHYMNYNFLLDSHAVTVTASASVQYTYGTPIWGYTHDITNLGLFNFYESLFLSAKVVGWADESGCSDCDGSPHDCNLPGEFYFWDPEECECVPPGTPIIIDLDGDGFDLTSPQEGVDFDLMADTIRRRVAWTTGGTRDAFLVLDRNENGVIDDGTELFGGFTPQPDPPRREGRNGFLALGVYDSSTEGGNGDGRITVADSIYTSLRLWLDDNHDGISQPAELFRLEQQGVKAVFVDYNKSRKVDEHGNVFRYRSKAVVDGDPADRRRAGARRMAVDVYLKYLH